MLLLTDVTAKSNIADSKSTQCNTLETYYGGFAFLYSTSINMTISGGTYFQNSACIGGVFYSKTTGTSGSTIDMNDLTLVT